VTSRRRFAAIILGMALSATGLAVACSAIDPVPPDPHGGDHSDPQELRNDPDASDAEQSS
jgi:hypothetical protein